MIEMDGQLIEAIKQGDVKSARLLATDQQLRRHGVNSVLELAVDLGQTDSVRVLLADHLHSQSEPLNREHASRALRLACRFPEEDTALCMVTALLEHGAGCHQGDVTRCERWGPSLLVAADRGHTRVIRLLIENCNTVNCSNHKNVLFEGAALDHAAFNGRKEVVKLLLAHGACVNQETTNRKPLASAARHGHTEIIQLLCEHDAPTDEVKGFALLEAAKYRHGEAADTLCRLGADPNFTSSLNASPFLTAQNQHEDVIRALCARDANTCLVVRWSPEHDKPPFIQKSALILAARKGHTDVIEALCANGADVNLIVERRTPLMRAAESGQVKAINVLCANGADVNVGVPTNVGTRTESHPLAPDEGTTALMMACERGRVRAVIQLLKNGCNVNLENRRGNTALHFCFYPHEKRNAFYHLGFALNSSSCALHQLESAQVLVKAGCTQSSSGVDYIGFLVRQMPGFQPTVQSELFKCLKLMLLAGWPVTQSTSQLMSRPDIKEELMANSIFDYVTRPHDNPPSLKHLCKFIIRGELRTPLERHLANTKLPPFVQKFVLLQDGVQEL